MSVDRMPGAPFAVTLALLGCARTPGPTPTKTAPPTVVQVSEVPPGLDSGATQCCSRTPEPGPKPEDGSRSCERARNAYIEAWQTQAVSEPPSAGQYAPVLSRRSYFAHCPVADGAIIDICAAVLEGRAVGVTVRTKPMDVKAASCIAGAVRGLSFPTSLQLDTSRARFP